MNIGTNSVFFYVRHSAANKRTKIILPSKRGERLFLFLIRF